VALCRSGVQSQLESRRVSVVGADYADPVALRTALRGVETLVFVTSDGEAARVLLHHRNVIRAAADSGVGHIVALSGGPASQTGRGGLRARTREAQRRGRGLAATA
jgi:uncharacterized protein YbjT (DUF2867 family)